MPINRNLKLLFIHIPKCAGSSAAKLINVYPSNRHEFNKDFLYGIENNTNLVLQTIPYHKYCDYINPQEFIKFSITRNPYSRFLSDYYWSGRHSPLCSLFTPIEALKEIKNTLQHNTWEDLLTYNEEHSNHFLPQYYYLSNLKGVIEKEISLIKLEELPEGINFIEKLTGNKMPHINASTASNKDFKEELPLEAIQLVNEIYYKDFEYLGYEML